MNIHYVCDPYPDEWIYSLAARTRLKAAVYSSSNLVRGMFACNRLSLGLALTENQNIVGGTLGHLTLFRFITSFLANPNKRAQARVYFNQGNHLKLAYLLGRTASRRLHCTHLRYCHECAKTQINRHGTPYWQRLPQVRGIEYCPIHRTDYSNSAIFRRHPGNLHPLEFVIEQAPKIRPPSTTREQNRLLLSMTAGRLLDKEPEWEPAVLSRAWRSLLSDYSNNRQGCELADRLSGQLNRHFGYSFLDTAGCSISGNLEHSWLMRFVRNPHEETDPLRHLIVLEAIGFSTSDLAQAAVAPTATKIDKLIRNRHPNNRPHSWINRLRSLWPRFDLSLREISRRLKADPKTVTLFAARIGLSFPRYSSRPTTTIPTLPMKTVSSVGEIKAKRELWTKALKLHGAQGTTRHSNPALYAWLYRRDRPWLLRNRPNCSSKPHRSELRANWHSRERRFLKLLPIAESEIKSARPFRRSTKLSLARKIGAESHLRYFYRMPRLRARVSAAVEDKVQFAIRRILTLYADGLGDLSYSEVRKLAGVPSSTATLPAVRDKILCQ